MKDKQKGYPQWQMTKRMLASQIVVSSLGGQDYEVQHFAQKYGLSAEQVRESLEQAAKQMKSGT